MHLKVLSHSIYTIQETKFRKSLCSPNWENQIPEFPTPYSINQNPDLFWNSLYLRQWKNAANDHYN